MKGLIVRNWYPSHLWFIYEDDTWNYKTNAVISARAPCLTVPQQLNIGSIVVTTRCSEAPSERRWVGLIVSASFSILHVTTHQQIVIWWQIQPLSKSFAEITRHPRRAYGYLPFVPINSWGFEGLGLTLLLPTSLAPKAPDKSFSCYLELCTYLVASSGTSTHSVIGVSLSEPHGDMMSTALACVCAYVPAWEWVRYSGSVTENEYSMMGGWERTHTHEAALCRVS